VVEASGLAGDIAAWANGDLFQAGENGQSLSGGQKARVGLARALYSRRPVMLVSLYWRRVTQGLLHIVAPFVCYIDGHVDDDRSFLLGL
jgi:ABC-type transport system involved in cytochrome bd biosynthesis fused ATPase/permease subunit